MLHVIYHTGNDGMCAGAIAKHAYPDANLIPFNYGWELSWKDIQRDDKVMMLDISLPADQMKLLNRLCAEFIWIDHHIQAIREMQLAGLKFAGKQITGVSSCELTWQWLHPDVPVPTFVTFIGRHDVHDFTDPYYELYACGLKSVDIRPNKCWKMWERLFCPTTMVDAIEEILDAGAVIKDYEDLENAKMVSGSKFPTTFTAPNGTTYKILAANIVGNRDVFKSLLDADSEYQMMASFYYTPRNRKWKVTMFSNKDVDCGAIAKQFNGGGRRDSGSFHCADLPFSVRFDRELKKNNL